ncbi:MAG: hypothetical protein GXP56_05890 [Deltaproteobacteria bacterium]|nr:hypothetical protein [Deltaproteobacteria bacterium]
MTINDILALFYILAGAAIIYLFKERRKAVALINHSQLPELSIEDFKVLKILLKTAYERMLYLGVLFLPLAFSTFRGKDKISTIFFFLLIGLLFISNVPPRHKIMGLLEKNGLSTSDLRHRGIKL